MGGAFELRCCKRETAISDAISVDKIIDVYYVVLNAYKMALNNPLVCFDYWQLLYLDRGSYTCSVDGNLFSLQTGQVMLCAPGGKRFVAEQKDACVAYISFRCDSDKMTLLKDKIISLNPKQQHLVSRIFTIGVEQFVDIKDQGQYYGQQTMAGTTDSHLQTMKNSIFQGCSKILQERPQANAVSRS